MSKISINDNWTFAEFPLDTPDSVLLSSNDLTPVEIPHDWMIWHTKDLYRDSIGFYRKAFFVHAAKCDTYIIRFEGIYMDSEVFLNGERIFEWKYGYSTFEVDLTDHLKDGENVLCVKCTYRNCNTRWYSGAGIYRNVWLIHHASSYLPTDGIYLSTEKEGTDFILTVDTEVCEKVPGTYTVRHTLTDKEGKILRFPQDDKDGGVRDGGTDEISGEKAASFAISEYKQDRQILKVNAPRLWDVNDPYYYTLRTDLCDGETVIDSIDTHVGFKTFSFDKDKGFFLNGKSVKINGVCMHHDLGALGSAMNKTALKRQLVSMKKMGVNGIRTSHNMPSIELLDLADEMGFLIYDESFDMWQNKKTDYDYARFFDEWCARDVASWIRRDRNRPCLIMWSIGNEISDTTEEKGLKTAVMLRDEVKKHDPRHNAFISLASNWMFSEWARKIADELDLVGYNYTERLYDADHKEHPGWCIYGSETGSTVQSRGIYHFPLTKKILTHNDGQCSCLGNCTTDWGARDVDYVISMHRDRDFAFGQFIWTGWDYIGEPTPFHSKNSYFGQVDTAGFEKDTYYLYQAEWTDVATAPMVHLLPYWDFNEGEPIDVIAYSNAPYVELFFNGVSQGRQFIDHAKGEHMRGHWILPYTPGELVVKASLKDGTVVATDSTRSFTDPVSIVAVSDKETLTADGKDLVFFSVSTADKEGTFVANAKNRVKVTVDGPARLVGVDNGDSTDYDEYKGNSRRLFSGRMAAIIQATKEEGEIKVTFSSEGLEGCTVMIRSFAAAQDDMKEVPVRKIELIPAGSKALTADAPGAAATYRIYPANATDSRLEFKAMTPNDVEADYVKVTRTGENLEIEALGDGDFTLTAYAYNGKSHPDVTSEIRYTVTGLGNKAHNPYEFLPGAYAADTNSGKVQISFEGGIFLSEGKPSFVTFDNVDFGPEGSDEITIPLFTFASELPLKVYEGTLESGECVFEGTYKAESIYNTYQSNTFKLNKKIRGIKSITLTFEATSKFSVKGFVFTAP